MSIFSGGFWNWCRGYTNGISFEQQEALKELANRVVNGKATKEDWEVIEKGSNIPVVQEVFELLKQIEKTCGPTAARELRQKLARAYDAIDKMTVMLEKSESKIQFYEEENKELRSLVRESQRQVNDLLRISGLQPLTPMYADTQRALTPSKN